MPSGFCLEINSKKNGKIKGGSRSKACPDQIEVGSWRWGGVKGDYSGGTTAKNVAIHEVSFTCPMSIASSALMHAAATGDPIKCATLSGRTEGTKGEEIVYMQLRFNDVVVSSYDAGGSGGDHPQESFTLHFAGVEISYSQQKTDGAVGQVRMAAYDSSTNTMVKPTLGS